MKRNLFAELQEGMAALAESREGKRTLRTYSVAVPTHVTISPQEIAALRERLHLSRPVFARTLHIKERTLESWEQGRAKPNEQAAVLLKMVERYPDTLDRLQALA
ncbi:helix-turn-helix domain-containing protein [Chitinilyticum aquatile]|uniref:helix-turn-helix domain-containing protein n=1 Tax=Chitinilyticum aquatile TaxID=362520 RepID=UPI00041714A7|nr:transcriptional regulator [Chitinilyticum aquatile]